jgi:Protein of unknown function (DUF3617)
MMWLRRFAYFAAAALTVLPAAAQGHGKVGLWNVSVTAKTLIDTSRMSPKVQAQLRAMGLLGGKGMTISDQHCMTAAEVARNDFEPSDANHGCKIVGEKNTSTSMSADMICTGDFTGKGHMQFTFDGETHYTGHMTMTGTRAGKTANTDMTFEGRWLKTDCGKVKS